MNVPARRALLFFLALAVSFLACGTQPADAAEPRRILISAAASLKNVLMEAGKEFEKRHPEAGVTFNFGASGQLLNQILSGAPVDIFISADIRDVAKLAERGLLASGSPTPFLRNELVFIVPAGQALTATSTAGLQDPRWKKIAIGNPRSVPAGRYAEEALRADGLSGGLEGRLVLCESVRQVLDYVARGEVDGGFVYRTDIRATRPGEVRQLFVVPPEKHSPIVYGYGRLCTTNHPDIQDAFLAFLAEPEATRIFTEAGFVVK